MPQKSVILISSATSVLVLCSLVPAVALATNASDEVWWAPSMQPTASAATTQGTLSTDSNTSRFVEFNELVSAWKNKSVLLSSVSSMILLPEYQRIVGMGEPAIPLLIGQLRVEGNDPDLWFWALTSITGENPVPEEDRGNLPRMSKAWMEWATDRGYVL